MKVGLPAISTVAVVVLAVVGGGAVAVRQRPVTTPAANAAPLRGDPTETPIKLTGLPTGRSPQMTYLTGRRVSGGAGGDIVVPGRQKILQAARYGGSVYFVLQTDAGGTELAWIDSVDGFLPERIPDVSSVAGSLAQDAIAYATSRSTARGSTLYWQGRGLEGRRRLQRPGDWGTTVLGVVGTTVYFATASGPSAAKTTLNSWDTATGKVMVVKGVVAPVATDYQGTLVIRGGTCSALTQLASGRQLWQTCDYSLGGFTFDGKTVFGRSAAGLAEGSAWTAAALDTSTAQLKRRWTGVRFLGGTAEDDDHLLFTVDDGAGSRGAIIRCAIGTGTCELATPLVKTTQADLRLLGAR